VFTAEPRYFAVADGVSTGTLPRTASRRLLELLQTRLEMAPVAELGAALTVGQLGMVDATIDGHASYVESWVRVLKGDKVASFTAASQASKAADFILAGQACQ